MTNESISRFFQKDRILNYLVQLSTVVIGIVITFAGSSLIERCSRKKELREVLHSVQNELKINRELLQTSLTFLEYESALYTQLDSVRHDIHQLSEDTLKKYRYYPFSYYNRASRRDAMDALKTSGLIQEINDKDFLVKLLGIYTSYEDFQLIRADYYKDKEECLNPLMRNLDKEKAEEMTQGSVWASWDYMWEDNVARNFFLSAPSRLHGVIYAGKTFLEETDELLNLLENY